MIPLGQFLSSANEGTLKSAHFVVAEWFLEVLWNTAVQQSDFCYVTYIPTCKNLSGILVLALTCRAEGKGAFYLL